MDSRQSMSMMGPPGYPHMPPMSSAGPTMTGEDKHDFKCYYENMPNYFFSLDLKLLYDQQLDQIAMLA